MKFILILICLLNFLITNAQHSENFEAVKKHQVYKFSINKPIKILYTKDNSVQEISGKLKMLKANGIYISSFEKFDSTLEFIGLDSIISVTKLLENNIHPIGFFGNTPKSIKNGWVFKIK